MMETIRQTLRGILFLLRKEFLVILKDPANRIILFAPALVQSLLFGYAATFDLNHVDYALLNQSKGQAARDLVTRLDGSGIFNRVATLNSSTEIAERIAGGDAQIVLSIPSNFDQQLAAGHQADLQLILDGRNSTTAGAAATYVNAVVSGFNLERSGKTPSISVTTRSWFNPNLVSRWGTMPALIAALSMMQTLLLSALSVAREREQVTFDQLLVTPLTPMQILVGKAVPAICVGLIQSTIIFLIILFWFKVPMNGSVSVLYLGLLCFNIASVGVGLSISALSANMQQAMLYTFLLIMPFMLLSGLMTPVAAMPPALEIATWCNPLRFAIDLVRRVYLEGSGLREVAVNFIPMTLMALFTLPLAAWLFRNRLY